MDLHISLAAEVLFHVGPIPVTNSMLTMFLVMALVLIVFTALARRAQAIPGRGQGLLEMIVEFLLNLVEGTGGKRLGRRIFPLVSGIFIFILFSNFSGLLPGVGTIGITHEEEHAEEEHADEDHSASTPESDVAASAVNDQGTGGEGDDAFSEDVAVQEETAEAATGEEEEHPSLTPLFRPPTADLNMTLALSLLTFTVVQVAGVSAHGVVGRLKHMADPPFLFPIEVISEFSRILSLSARLFGNVFAGEVLLGVMYAMGAAIKIALVPALFPVLFLFLEVMFGTIQALVFALLTLIYISLAAAHGDSGEEHAHGPAEQAGHPPADTAHGTAPAPSGD
jgi:F-type H+-transporting ATPase subunit a